MTIVIKEKEISYYIERLIAGVYFAYVSYGDAEWYCVLRRDIGKATGLGQILNACTGDKLLEVLRSRQKDTDFLVGTPKCLWTREDCVSGKVGEQIEGLLQNYGIDLVLYE